MILLISGDCDYKSALRQFVYFNIAHCVSFITRLASDDDASFTEIKWFKETDTNEKRTKNKSILLAA